MTNNIEITSCGKWIRTCQECGYEQADMPPSTGKELTNGYINRKCKSCRSQGSLDYGSYEWNPNEDD